VMTPRPKPASIDFDQAAGLVTGGMTALRLARAAGIESGQTVLVQGGAGGDVTARSAKVVRPGGLLMTIANRPPEEACAAARIRCPAFIPTPTAIGPELRELATLVDAGEVKAHVDQVFRLPKPERRSSSARPVGRAARSCSTFLKARKAVESQLLAADRCARLRTIAMSSTGSTGLVRCS